jgi:hypothetical protein
MTYYNSFSENVNTLFPLFQNYFSLIPHAG